MRVMPTLHFFDHAFKSTKTALKRAVVGVLLVVFVAACTTTGGGPKQITKAQKSRADRAMVHTQLARGYLQQDQFATAKQQLERALSIDPNHSDSNYVMALLMLKLEQNNKAEQFFTRAVRSDPENSPAAHDFGVYLCQVGKERDAVKNFEIAVSNPLFDKAQLSYMRAGECLLKIKDPAAEQYLKRALSINPQLRPALYQLALLKFEAQSFMSARAYIERYFAITNPQPGSLLLAYKIESELNALDVAEGYRTRLLIDFPGSKEAGSVRQSRN